MTNKESFENKLSKQDEWAVELNELPNGPMRLHDMRSRRRQPCRVAVLARARACAAPVQKRCPADSKSNHRTRETDAARRAISIALDIRSATRNLLLIQFLAGRSLHHSSLVFQDASSSRITVARPGSPQGSRPHDNGDHLPGPIDSFLEAGTSPGRVSCSARLLQGTTPAFRTYGATRQLRGRVLRSESWSYKPKKQRVFSGGGGRRGIFARAILDMPFWTKNGCCG
jgi:hypothetical protein